MNYSQFIVKIQENLQENLGADVLVETVSVRKNNGIVLQGVTIRGKGERVAPTIYMERFYEDYLEGRILSDILDEVLEVYEQHIMFPQKEFDFFQNYEEVRKYLAMKLVNKKRNAALLEDMPYMDFLDLAVLFYCLVDSPAAGTVTIQIKKIHMEHWNITLDTLFRDALHNAEKMLPGEIMEMEEMIAGMMLNDSGHADGKQGDFQKEFSRLDGKIDKQEGFPELEGFPKLEGASKAVQYPGLEGIKKSEQSSKQKEWKEKNVENHIPLLILTNNRKYLGAACMLYPNLLENFSEKIKQGFYILPSSIHEVILLPENNVKNSRQLVKMVSEINETQLAPEDVLADTVYYYDRKSRRIRIFQ